MVRWFPEKQSGGVLQLETITLFIGANTRIQSSIQLKSAIIDPLFSILLLEPAVELAQSLPDVLYQIIGMLHPNADPDQPPIDRLITHRPPLNQAFHATQRGGMVEQLEVGRESTGEFWRGKVDGENGSVPVRHLFLDPIVLRVFGLE